MDSNYDTKEAETIFSADNNAQLKHLYKKYNVEAVEVCLFLLVPRLTL